MTETEVHKMQQTSNWTLRQAESSARIVKTLKSQKTTPQESRQLPHTPPPADNT